VLRLGRVHLSVIGAFVAALWATQFAGWIDAIDFLAIYTVICAVTVALYLPWISWRERRVTAERAECRRLLDDLRA